MYDEFEDKDEITAKIEDDMSDDMNRHDKFEDNDKMPDKHNGESGLAIASMILGIISIVLCYFWRISMAAGIAGIVLGTMHNRKYGRCGMSAAGVICGIIGITLTIIGFLLIIVSFLLFGEVLRAIIVQ